MGGGLFKSDTLLAEIAIPFVHFMGRDGENDAGRILGTLEATSPRALSPRGPRALAGCRKVEATARPERRWQLGVVARLRW